MKIGFGLRYHDTQTYKFYPNLWVSHWVEDASSSRAGHKSNAKWFSSFREAEQELERHKSNVMIVPLEKPPFLIRLRRGLAWFLMDLAKQIWSGIED